MKKSNRKGFTIVELVIVIAVIAILAAVLIPTFSNLIKKANQSSDIQAARQMNTVLAAEQGIGDNIDKVIDVLVENGYSANGLTPVTADHKFYYVVADECIVLFDEKKGEVVFPADVELTDASVKYDLSENVKYINAEVSDAAGLAEAIENGQMEIKLLDNLTITSELDIKSNVTIDLNGKELDASGVGGRPFNVKGGATVTINAEGATIKCGLYGLVNVPTGENATIIINGGNFTANLDNGAFIKVRPEGEGSTVNVTLNNVTYTDVSSDSYVINSLGFKGTMNLSVNGGNYKAQFGFQAGNANLSFENVTIDTSAATFEISASTATIKNCTITTGNSTMNGVPAAAVSVSSGGKATVTGCTITSEMYSYMVLNTGGEIKHGDNIVNKGTEYIYPLDAGVTGSITPQ